MDATAERGQQADPPVADLVAEALDDDGAVGGERAQPLLVAEERQEVVRSALVEVVLLPEPTDGARVRERREGPRRLADLPAELVGPSNTLALPEGHRTGDARRRRDQDPVARDLLDSPGRGAEHEGLPLAG